MKSAFFVEFITIFVKFNIYKHFFVKFIIRRLITDYPVYHLKICDNTTERIKDGVKKGLFATLKANANSSGCYIIYQPKTPKGFEKFKNIK